VRSPGGEVLVDPTGRAPGRGAYVCDDAACQQNALTRGALRRALAASVPATLIGPPPAPGADPDEMITDHEGGS
jgi:predicted RNA-binding protein YlxR (DUF448 family)